MGGGAANSKLSPKASKMCVFSGKYAKKISFFEVLETKGVGECGDLKIVSRSQNMRDSGRLFFECCFRLVIAIRSALKNSVFDREVFEN